MNKRIKKKLKKRLGYRTYKIYEEKSICIRDASNMLKEAFKDFHFDKQLNIIYKSTTYHL